MKRRGLDTFQCQALAALYYEHLHLHGGLDCLQGHTSDIAPYLLYVGTPNQYDSGANQASRHQC
jgi:hypothetical protein